MFRTMRKSRRETIRTPLNQSLDIQWYIGSVSEIENVLSSVGLIRIKTDNGVFLVRRERTEGNSFQVFSTTSDDVGKKEIHHLEELFSGDIEFFVERMI